MKDPIEVSLWETSIGSVKTPGATLRIYLKLQTKDPFLDTDILFSETCDRPYNNKETVKLAAVRQRADVKSIVG